MRGKIVKKIFKKNQIIITALAIMIAAAGYINYSDSGLQLGESKRRERIRRQSARRLISTQCSLTLKVWIRI